MGFFKALTTLFDEGSDASFEKKFTEGLDKIEQAIGGAVDKAEAGIKKVDQVGQKAAVVSTVVEDTSKKMADTAGE